MGTILVLIFVALIVMVALNGFKIVNQAQVMIIERLGKFHRKLEPGLQFIIPFVDVPRGVHIKRNVTTQMGQTFSIYNLTERIDLRETVYDFPKQNVITKDNVQISINTLIYFQIMNPESAVYEIENLPEAIEKLTQTTLRNVIGEMDLQTTFTSRDTINVKLKTILDEASNKWGVKVNRVELQDIVTPADIQSAMDKQMKADRDKRAAILEAEGIRESKIQRAEGEKQAAILVAEGNAQARIKEAQGEAEAIRNVIDALKDSGQPDKYLIAMKYIETLKQMTSGKDNKVVYMPYEATGILSSVDGIKQTFDKN